MLVQPLVLLRRVEQTRDTRNIPDIVQARLRGRQTGSMGRSRHEPPSSKGRKPPQQQQQHQKSSVLSQLDVSTKPNCRVEALLGWDIFQVLQLRMQTHSATSNTVHCALVQLARSEQANQPLFHRSDELAGAQRTDSGRVRSVHRSRRVPQLCAPVQCADLLLDQTSCSSSFGITARRFAGDISGKNPTLTVRCRSWATLWRGAAQQRPHPGAFQDADEYYIFSSFH